MAKEPRPASHKLFGSYLSGRRNLAKLTQQELADRLSIKRETLSQWERGILEFLPEPEAIRVMSEALATPAWRFIAAFGYGLGFEGIESEEEPEILAAYREFEPLEQRQLRAVLGLEGELTLVEYLESLHRLAEMGRLGRLEIRG